MKILINERLSEHKYKTPEGYLICVDAILARTGKQEYRRAEVFGDSCDDADEVIEIDRTEDEVFSPQTLASFENKPITVEHPDVDVNSDNYKDYAVGFVRDVKRGIVDGQDVILGTLVITDRQTIEEIEDGEHTDLSCGYDCDIIDEDNPQQRNIRGNHVALCAQGRAGIARIVDSKVEDDGKNVKVCLSKERYAVVSTKEWKHWNEDAYADFTTNEYSKAKAYRDDCRYDTIIIDCYNNYSILDSVKDDDYIKVKLDGKIYKAENRGESRAHPGYYDVFIKELIDYNNVKNTPKDDLGYKPKDGKYYVKKGNIVDSIKDFEILSDKQRKELANYAKRFEYDWDEIIDGLNFRIKKEGMTLSEAIEDVKEDMVKGKSLYDSIVKDAKKPTDYKSLAKELQQKFHTKFIAEPEDESIYAPYVYGDWKLDKEITNYLKQKGYKIMFNGVDDSSRYNFEDSIKDINPRANESKKDFISRFMSETKSEYPDEKQRYAVALSYWERKGKDSVKDYQSIKIKLNEEVKPNNKSEFGGLALSHNYLNKTKSKGIYEYSVPYDDFRKIETIKRNIKQDLKNEGYSNFIFLDSVKDDALNSLRELIKREQPNTKKELREVYKSWARKEHHGAMYEDEFRKMCEEFNITDSIKDWKVRVLYSDGSYCGTYNVDYTGKYDSTKILKEFYKKYPQYRDDIFLVSITDSVKDEIKSQYVLYVDGSEIWSFDSEKEAKDMLEMMKNEQPNSKYTIKKEEVRIEYPSNRKSQKSSEEILRKKFGNKFMKGFGNDSIKDSKKDKITKIINMLAGDSKVKDDYKDEQWFDYVYDECKYEFVRGGYGMKFKSRADYQKAKDYAKKIGMKNGYWDDKDLEYSDYRSTQISNDY